MSSRGGPNKTQTTIAVGFAFLMILSTLSMGVVTGFVQSEQSVVGQANSQVAPVTVDNVSESASSSSNYINWFTVPDLGRTDKDDDGYYSNFDVSVSADTNLDTPVYRTTDPYFVVFIDETEILEQNVPAKEATWPMDIPKSDLEELSLDRGEVNIKIELRNSQIGEDPVYDSTTTTISYENQTEDLSDRQKGLNGIESLADPYDESANYLSKDYWFERQLNSVDNAMNAMIPTSEEDILLEAALELLDAPFADTLTTAPTVVDNVDNSLEEGKIHSTLIKTSSSTRSGFHNSLDELRDNTSAVTSNSGDLNETLENRLDLIETVYKKSLIYESEVENSYTDNQEFFPEIIIWLYGADKNSFKTVQGFFDQLQQNLRADYQFTQKARYPNETLEELDDTVSGVEPDYPEAEVTDITVQDTPVVGEPVTVSMTVRTRNADTPSQTMTLGFPDGENIENLRIANHDLTDPSSAKVYDSGSEFWTRYGEEQQVMSYPIVELADEMSQGETHTVDVTFTPTETSDIRLWAKSVAWSNDGSGSLNPDPGWQDDGDSDVVRDGQNELAYERVIPIKEQEYFDVEFSTVDQEVVAGNEIEAVVSVENTGGIADEQTIALNVDGNVEDSTPVTLDSGDGTEVTLTYETDSSDAGEDLSLDVETDGVGGSDTATVTVTPGNSRPTANDFSVSTNEAESVDGEFDANDPDNDPLTYSVTSGPSHGQVENSDTSDSAFTYTPDDGYSGTDSFTYKVSDGNGGTDTATVDITVNSAGSGPSFGVSATTNSPVTEGGPLELTVDIENTGDEPGSQTIDVDVGALGSKSRTVSLESGESTTETFTFATEQGDAGTYSVTASSADDTAQTSVTVEEAQTGGEATLALEDVTAQAGNTVSVDLTASGEDIAGYQTNITFDPSVVQVESVKGISFPDPTVNIDNEAGFVFVTQSIASGITDPLLANLTFDVVGSGGESTPLSLVGSDSQLTNSNSANIETSLDDGSVSVTEASDAVFETTLTEVPETVTAGDELPVSITVSNTGGREGTKTVEYDIVTDAGTTVFSGEQTLTLAADETTTITFSYETGESDTPRLTVSAATSDDSDTATVTVEQNLPSDMQLFERPDGADQAVRDTIAHDASTVIWYVLRDASGERLTERDVTLTGDGVAEDVDTWADSDGLFSIDYGADVTLISDETVKFVVENQTGAMVTVENMAVSTDWEEVELSLAVESETSVVAGNPLEFTVERDDRPTGERETRANLTFVDNNGTIVKTFNTGLVSDGAYGVVETDQLEPGEYNVTAHKPNFQEKTFINNTVSVKITSQDDSNTTLADYANEQGIIDTDGLRNAIDDWRANRIGTDLLRDVIAAWRSGEPVV